MKLLIGLLLIGIFSAADGRCSRGCDTALASYYVWRGSNLTFISQLTQTPFRTIVAYNPQITNEDSVMADTPVNLPFSCDCRNGEYLLHVFSFTTFTSVTYHAIAGTYYSNLTTAEELQRFNKHLVTNILENLDTGVTVYVPVNCSCGDSSVSSDYGLFVTYPLREGETLESVAATSNLPADLVRRYNPAANFSSGSGLVYIPGRDSTGSFPPLNPRKDGLSGGAIAGIMVAGIVGVLLVAGCLCVVLQRKRIAKKILLLSAVNKDSSHLQDALSRFNLEELPLFTFEILAIATNGFSNANKLGKGGFGTVYKGELIDGREIAVKRLSEASGQGMHEFMNEVVLISKLQHRNLVRLLGCCVENDEKMLVYEYMPNKSLDVFLFDQSQDILDWRKRFTIVEGICRGLLYLHRDSRVKIIHRDLKPSNILLDNDWNPKVSDFGMARIFVSNQDHINTVKVVGTYGYMAPEYAIEGRFSEKSDVFSFGVMILEIISGRKNTSFYNHQCSLNLLGHVWKLWNENEVAATIDVRISSPSYRTDVLRCIHIGLLCVQELPQNRPSISAVLSMLTNEIELPEPKQAAFTLSIATSSQQTASNNLTLTSMLHGR